MPLTPFTTFATLAENATTTTAAGSESGMAIPPLFLALGIGGIVVMTIVWFYLKKGGKKD